MAKTSPIPEIAKLMERHGERWPHDMKLHRGQWEDSMATVFEAFRISPKHRDRWKLLALALAFEYQRGLLEPIAKSKGGHPKAPPQHTAAQERLYREFGRYRAERLRLSQRAAANAFLKDPKHKADCVRLAIGAAKTLEKGLRRVRDADRRTALIQFGHRRAYGIGIGRLVGVDNQKNRLPNLGT